MTVQVVHLNTGEHIITDIGKYVDQTDSKNQVYIFRKPLRILEEEPELMLTETAELRHPNDVEIRFLSWLRYSKNDECLVELQNVIYICEPVEELLELYNEAIDSGGHTHQRTSLLED